MIASSSGECQTCVSLVTNTGLLFDEGARFAYTVSRLVGANVLSMDLGFGKEHLRAPMKSATPATAKHLTPCVTFALCIYGLNNQIVGCQIQSGRCSPQ